MITPQQIKDRWPLRAMLSRLGVQVPPRGKFHSPFRPDKTPSCEIYRETIRDRSTGETFDSIAVFAALKGLSNGEAVKMLAEEISPREQRFAPSGPGREKSASSREAQKVGCPEAVPQDTNALTEQGGSKPRVARPPFRRLEAPTADDLAELGRRRHIFDTALRTAASLGRLHFAETAEGRAWVVTDSARRVCQARRLDGLPWERIRSKAWTAVKSEGQASWPLGAGEIGDRARVILCEGGPDWLVAHEAEPDLAVCAMLGANQSLHPEALPHFSGKRVRILAHGDRAGEEAGRKWAAELKHAGAFVTAVEIAFDGALDLNDCTRLSLAAWRAHSISTLLA